MLAGVCHRETDVEGGVIERHGFPAEDSVRVCAWVQELGADGGRVDVGRRLAAAHEPRRDLVCGGEEVDAALVEPGRGAS